MVPVERSARARGSGRCPAVGEGWAARMRPTWGAPRAVGAGGVAWVAVWAPAVPCVRVVWEKQRGLPEVVQPSRCCLAFDVPHRSEENKVQRD